MTTGAEALVSTLADCGVTACFANPGTSEMHLVAALDREPRVRSVLALFEGVASGAADGYARIAGKPAMTLLHLGSGLANAGANLHNARRAFSPIVNIVGDHAVGHLAYDAPLTSDIAGIAQPLSTWVKSAPTAHQTGAYAAEAYAASLSGARGPVALILPADCAWNEGGRAGGVRSVGSRPAPGGDLVEAAARAVRGAKSPVVVVNREALLEPGLAGAARLTAAGVRIVSVTFPARMSRGAGRATVARMAYFAEMAMAELAGVDVMILAGTKEPAAFFAYPGRPSLFVPEGCAVHTLATEAMDTGLALSALADALGARDPAAPETLDLPASPQAGPLTPEAVGAVVARHLPEGAIVCDDGITGSVPAFLLTPRARPHEWLFNCGGAIGIGMPLAVGAAVAAPDRKVVALSGDGSAMYTNQALWTMAREGLDVTVVVYANRSYRILNIEFARTGAGNPGPSAASMLSLDNPAIDFVALARAMGVEAVRCETAEAFERVFSGFMGVRGPKLIEAVV